MRVTMVHREESGMIPDDKRYYVDTTVFFSEEERAIIKARGLGSQTAAVGYRAKIPSEIALEFPAFLRAIAPLAIYLSAAVWLFYRPQLGMLLLLATAIGWAWGHIAPILHARAIRPYIVEVRDILNERKFSFYAETPAHARRLANNDLTKQLTNLKVLITESAELAPKLTFEL